jgi:CheY-like chemotaxis protein
MEKDIELAIKKINSLLNFVYSKVEDREVKSLLKDSKLNINSIKNIMEKKAIAYKPINILIADDVKLNTCILEAMLDNIEHKIYVVHDGEEALEKMKELNGLNNSIDILLIDHRMPNMIGSQAVNIIRKDQVNHSHNNLKVISITNEPNAIIEYQHLYDKHISKPFLKDEIIEIIKSLKKDIRNKR